MLVFRNSVFSGSKTGCPLISQFRQSLNWGDVHVPYTNYNICVKPFTTSVTNLVKYNPDNEWTDDSFSKRYVQALKQPKVLLKGLYNFAGEFGKLYKEKKEEYGLNHRKFQFQDPTDRVDMLFTFDSENELNRFSVATDGSHYGGYSSASLKITPAKTGLFTGNICSELVKDGEAKFAGYATMLSRKAVKSFKRIKTFDWSYYTHMVFKVKGDGRTYFVHFSVKVDFDSHQSWVYSYPLFTRGGPYWQVSKIPFSDFYFISKGNMGIIQPKNVPLRRITTVGLTTRQVEGPFKLEIDYIGLEMMPSHRQISPYEHYA